MLPLGSSVERRALSSPVSRAAAMAAPGAFAAVLGAIERASSVPARGAVPLAAVSGGWWGHAPGAATAPVPAWNPGLEVLQDMARSMMQSRMREIMRAEGDRHSNLADLWDLMGFFEDPQGELGLARP